MTFPTEAIVRPPVVALLAILVTAGTGCCFGGLGGGIPDNPPTPEGYVSGAPYAHCLTATTPYDVCTEIANTGPTSPLGRHDMSNPILPPFALCQNQRAELGECPRENRVGACISQSGRRLYVDYAAGTNSSVVPEMRERSCTALPNAHYVHE